MACVSSRLACPAEPRPASRAPTRPAWPPLPATARPDPPAEAVAPDDGRELGENELGPDGPDGEELAPEELGPAGPEWLGLDGAEVECVEEVGVGNETCVEGAGAGGGVTLGTETAGVGTVTAGVVTAGVVTTGVVTDGTVTVGTETVGTETVGTESVGTEMLGRFSAGLE